MADRPLVVFESISKKFRRGERHDSLRDMLPSAFRRLLGQKPEQELGEQEFWAVRDVSFEVARGEALGIIGPNGAGKSTILKLLTRILKPTKGHCEVRGRVGALIEVAAGFHPDLTGRENVYLQGSIMGMSRSEIEESFDGIVDFSGVSDFIDTPVKRYSSGMNARLGFAIAAHLRPEVLIIDEVLAVGDAAFQTRCLARLEELKRQGAALVFVSHNLPAVEVLCHRALFMEQGAAALLGAPREAIARHLAPKFKQASGAGRPINRSGDQTVVITDVKITNGEGQVVSHFPSGVEACFEFILECREGPRQVIVGIALLSIDRVTLFGENTTVSIRPIEMAAGEVVRCRLKIDSLALHEGRYFLTVEAASPATNAIYDAHQASYSFDVDSLKDYNRAGVLGLRTHWSCELLGEEPEAIAAGMSPRVSAR